MKAAAGLVLVFVLGPAIAVAQESKLHAEFRLEAEHVKKECGDFGLKPFAGCAMAVVTEHPLHLSLGSIAPGNGFGLGPALALHRTPNENWRLGLNSDAVAAAGGAWRAGGYFKGIRTAVEIPRVVTGGAPHPSAPITIHEYPIVSLYLQAISLPRVAFFGLGSQSRRDDRTEFQFHETLLGSMVTLPVTAGVVRRFGLSVVGELNARFIDVSPSRPDAPSIESHFSATTAPGLTTQPSFLQLGEAATFKPAWLNGHLNGNYMVQWAQFLAPTNSSFSFRRWTVDLNHDVPLYHTSAPTISRDINGPDDCATGISVTSCPPISRDRWGTVSFRVVMSKSGVDPQSVVPFYFQQTIGGSDINGFRALPSYADYRFRGQDIFLTQIAFEHSVYGPVGMFLAADGGQVAGQGETLDFGALKRSFCVGITMRAGGFPAVVVSYATGGPEGHHVIFTVSTVLLGGSSRPSLY